MRNQFKLLFILFVLLIPFSTIAQEITLGGAVLSQGDRTPLPGATVSIKGTSSGVLTDVDGNFSITSKPGNILVISFVGYESQSYVIRTTEFLKVELKENV